MRLETRLALLSIALGVLCSAFMVLNEALSCFLCGMFVALGLFFVVVDRLPDNMKEKLLYRKAIGGKRG